MSRKKNISLNLNFFYFFFFGAAFFLGPPPEKASILHPAAKLVMKVVSPKPAPSPFFLNRLISLSCFNFKNLGKKFFPWEGPPFGGRVGSIAHCSTLKANVFGGDSLSIA